MSKSVFSWVPMNSFTYQGATFLIFVADEIPNAAILCRVGVGFAAIYMGIKTLEELVPAWLEVGYFRPGIIGFLEMERRCCIGNQSSIVPKDTYLITTNLNTVVVDNFLSVVEGAATAYTFIAPLDSSLFGREVLMAVPFSPEDQLASVFAGLSGDNPEEILKAQTKLYYWYGFVVDPAFKPFKYPRSSVET